MSVNTNPSVRNLITCLFIRFKLEVPSIEGSKDKNLVVFQGYLTFSVLNTNYVIMRKTEERTIDSILIVQSAPNDRIQAIFSTRQ
jgi:hypothetical protein